MAETENFGVLEVGFESNKQQLNQVLNDIKSKINQVNTQIGKSVGSSLSSSLNKEFANIGRNFAQLGTQITRQLTRIGLVAGVSIGAYLFKGIKDSLKDADSSGLFDTLFGSYSKTLDKMNKEFSRSMNINKYEYKKVVTDMGIFLKGSGISGDSTGKMASNLSKRAYDLSSFFNIDPSKASEIIQSALSGRTKGFLQSTGIKLTIDSKSSIGDRYNSIMNATSSYAGQWGSQMGELPNQIEIIVGKFKEFRTEIGYKFQPALQKIVNALPAISSGLGKLATNLSDKLVKYLEGVDWEVLFGKIEKFIEWIVDAGVAIGNFIVDWPKLSTFIFVGGKTGILSLLGKLTIELGKFGAGLAGTYLVAAKATKVLYGAAALNSGVALASHHGSYAKAIVPGVSILGRLMTSFNSAVIASFTALSSAIPPIIIGILGGIAGYAAGMIARTAIYPKSWLPKDMKEELEMFTPSLDSNKNGMAPIKALYRTLTGSTGYNGRSQATADRVRLANISRSESAIIDEWDNKYWEDLATPVDMKPRIPNFSMEDMVEDLYANFFKSAKNLNDLTLKGGQLEALFGSSLASDRRMFVGQGTGFNSAQYAMSGSEFWGSQSGQSQDTRAIVSELRNIVTAIKSAQKDYEKVEKTVTGTNNEDMNTEIE